MTASLRLEIFPSELERCLSFYLETLQFTIRRRKDNYVFMNRGNIFIAAIGVPSDETLEEKKLYRAPEKGLEIVFEVDDLAAERDRIVSKGYKLDADLKTQEWGLTDFRVFDPDGYYLRFTTHSPGRDSSG